ncbi:MAG: SDR family oxidoreductase [Betaproteobacteria bacterium]|jgi:NAD(P)-dependent dehydrogenase (short-subunit alcohol dehydrogenase family)|nr:SDR family oxidoreductase [Betaproteobacteria bacterium]
MKITVTGAASGIGKATVLKLLESGHELIVIDLPDSNFDFLSKANVQIILGDVSDQSDRNVIIAASTGVDGLVNAAGRIETRNLLDYSIADIRELFSVNFESVWDLTAKIGATMPTGGAIVNISSAGAKVVTNSNVGPYAATKAAVLSLTRTFAFEFAKRGVRVNAICPGLIETPMQTKVSEQLAKDQNLPIKDVIQKRIEMIPLNRFGNASECADLISFLLSSESSYMTGQAINISGGWITS